MATTDDKRRIIKLARQGKLEGDDGFRAKLADLVKSGCTGPGRDWGLDYNDKPYYRSALWEATWKNHEAIVKLLVDKGATIDFADYQGRTPLHEAAYYGYKNLVEYFLDKGHPIDPFDIFGQTPLFRAAEAGRDEIVKTLVERKAQTNLLDNHGVTVQHMSSFRGMPDMSEWLLYKGSWKNRFAINETVPGERQTARDGPAAPGAGGGQEGGGAAAAAAPAEEGGEAAAKEDAAAAAGGGDTPAKQEKELRLPPAKFSNN